jgi:large subunit ribosomal protein L23
MQTPINLFPLTTEKAFALSKNNVYVFDVPTEVNRQQVKQAVETQFKVKVTGVKTLIQTGKVIRFSKGKRSQPGITKRQDAKKAYVSLAKGSKIKVFDKDAVEPKAKTEVKEKQ